jgi:hypothetical protein
LKILYYAITQLTLRAGRAARGSRDVEARYPFLPVAPFHLLTTFGFVTFFLKERSFGSVFSVL